MSYWIFYIIIIVVVVDNRVATLYIIIIIIIIIHFLRKIKNCPFTLIDYYFQILYIKCFTTTTTPRWIDPSSFRHSVSILIITGPPPSSHQCGYQTVWTQIQPSGPAIIRCLKYPFCDPVSPSSWTPSLMVLFTPPTKL